MSHQHALTLDAVSVGSPTLRTAVTVVVGTRPEAIKLRSVVTALGPRARVVHTGQHYDADLWHQVVADLALPAPEAVLSVGGTHRGEQIGEATALLTRYLVANPTGAVVVQGDTNSTLAGALAANATATFLVHVEAGLRSGDRTMPEESNRLLVDRIADLCCAPTPANAAALLAEGVDPTCVAVTGNTLADTVQQLLPTPAQAHTVLQRHGVVANGYVLATVHRAANVDDAQQLAAVVGGLARVADQAPVLLPLHPRTRQQVAASGLQRTLGGVRVLPPLTPSDFLALLAGAGLVVSDSGGVGEEAALLRRPLVVLRDSTERPELLAGWSVLVGADDPGDVIRAAWDDAPAWARRLATMDAPYPAVAAGAAVVRELDARLGGSTVTP